ncbi:MAG: DUF4238 domain-containing protein [Flavobacteriaceae bacterium]|nr:DUF4238 domain-containing protein [Flavobacteriaceae bacterium]
MSEPKLHHYVPRFYLSRFTDANGKLWVFDKQENNVFSSRPDNLASQKRFYHLEELAQHGLDPLTLEKQFAGLEYEVSNITNDWFKQFVKSDTLSIPDINRDLISLYITTQLLRTVEAREQLIQFLKIVIEDYNPETDVKNLHASLLWEDDLVAKIKERIVSCIWIFGKNESKIPFLTSDHPIAIKSFDNKQWMLGPGIFDDGMYVVFPLAPSLILYCKDPEYWKKLKPFENSISPVKFTEDMVRHENSGQIGMSYRFVYANNSDFSFAKDFLADNVDFKKANRQRF